jgi:tRNA-dihydrouridine synthase
MTAPAHPGLAALPPVLEPGLPPSALAPMQDVTTLPFMRVIARRGAPDWFFTEYFRVHETSRLEPHILSSVTENDTGRPVFAQLIGECLPDLARTVRELSRHPVAGIDLNLGCPAPKVYRKNVGGGLLRDPARVDEILALLRAECPGRFTVKMRLGFDSWEHFPALLDSVNRHRVDLLSVHGRTVKEMYRAEVHYDGIRQAVQTVRCPVLANGNVTSAAKARWVLAETGAAGVMVGRAAIRNPWIFRQIREILSGQPVFQPTLADARAYVEDLHHATAVATIPDRQLAGRLKKFLNFVGQAVDPAGQFLYDMRRAETVADLLTVCDRYMIDDGHAAEPFPEEAHPGLVARPNREEAVAAEPAACSLFDE